MKYSARKAVFAAATIVLLWVLVFWVIEFLYSGIYNYGFYGSIEDLERRYPGEPVTGYDRFAVFWVWRDPHPVLTLWLVLAELGILVLALFGVVQLVRWSFRSIRRRVKDGS